MINWYTRHSWHFSYLVSLQFLHNILLSSIISDFIAKTSLTLIKMRQLTVNRLISQTEIFLQRNKRKNANSRQRFFAKRLQSSGNSYNVDNCGFSINFGYRSDGGSNPFEGCVGTADDCVISLRLIFDEADVSLAGTVFSEEFEDSVPNSVHDSPFGDTLLAYNSKS